MAKGKETPKNWLDKENYAKTVENYRTNYPFSVGTYDNGTHKTLYDFVFNNDRELDYIDIVEISLVGDEVKVNQYQKSVKKYIDKKGIHLGNIIGDFVDYGVDGFKKTMFGTPTRTLEVVKEDEKEKKKAA